MVPEWARRVFGKQSDEALHRLAEREDARREVENTRWYKMVKERLEQELDWTEKELRNVSVFHVQRLQAYANSIEMLVGFVSGTEKGGSAAKELLSERIEKAKPKTVDEFMDSIMGAHN